MNLFQLVLKQMRQRALSTWLTLLSVVLGSALAISVLILRRESSALFLQSDYGYDLLVGAKGSPMQLVLNTVYHIDRSPGNIPYIVYEALRNNTAMVKHAIPYAVGDQYESYRVAGTVPEYFGFDFEGKTLRGYDERGNLLPGYQSPDLREDLRDPNKPVAADTFDIRLGKRFTLADGRVFHPRKFEAVLGAEIPARTGLKLGSTFKVRHDQGKGKEDDEHDEQWTVVGILNPTHTAEDRVIFIPLVSFYAIPKHEEAMDQQAAIRMGEDLSRFAKKGTKPAPKPPATTQPAGTRPAAAHDDHDDHDHAPAVPKTGPATKAATPAHDEHDHAHDAHAATKPASAPATAATAPAEHAHAPGEHHDHDEAYILRPDGTIDLQLPKDRWQLSAVLVRTRSGYYNMMLQNQFQNGTVAAAVNPAGVMREFFRNFLSPITLILLVISMLVVITAAVSILVSIYNAVSARAREIAIIRALGATRGKVLAMICVEAGLIGAIGGLLGLVIGHSIGAVQSYFFAQRLGVGINYLAVDSFEWIYLGGIVVLAVLAGLVPGLKAYRTPVATNLVAA